LYTGQHILSTNTQQAEGRLTDWSHTDR